MTVTSSIQTGLIAQFDDNVHPINQYYLDPNSSLHEGSANALSISGGTMYVAGTFIGTDLQIGDVGSMHANSNTLGSGNTKDLWMAKFDFNNNMFLWIEGSESPDPVNVNDISYDGSHAYIGGNYSMDMYLPNVPLLHPMGGSGIQLGYIVRGGDFSTGGGQGAFYKTSNNQTDFENDVELDAETKITLYPNPNNGAFTLRLDGELTGETQLVIYDVTGRIVYQNTTQKTSNTIELPLSPQGLSKGIYMITIELNGLTEYQKFTVQ